MMFYLSPTSARPSHSYPGFPFSPNPHAGRPQARPTPFDYGYPNHELHEHYHYPYSGLPSGPYCHVDVDAAVERAAREYAIAQRRAQALEQERLRRVRAIQEHRRRLEEQRRAQAQAEVFAEMAAAMEHLAATRQSRRAQLYEEYERAKAEEVVRFQATLRRQREAVVRRREEAQNAFLDALGLRHPECEEPRRVPAMPQPQPVPSPKATAPQERLRRRLEVDEDAEVQEVIENLLNLFIPSAPAHPQETKPAESPVRQDKGKARESPVAFPWERPAKNSTEPNNINEAARTVRFNVPVATPAAPRQTTPPTSIPTPSQAEHTNLRRVPAMRRSVDTQLSLGAIDRISTLFQELKSSFVFPTDLDHSRSSSPSPVTPDSDSAQLPFTSKNKPVHVYEHALNGLLAKLDEVDSHGDEEVRRRRKEVVLEVEKALAEVDRKVAEASPKLEKSSLPEETEISPPPTAPVVAEAAVASTTEAETKPEVAEEVPIASSDVSSPPLVTEESVPAATQSEATEEDTQTTDTTSSVVVDSEAVLDAVPVVIESEDVSTSSGIHTDSIANPDLSANAEASEGEDTVVPENPSTDVAIREPELEVLPPTVESAAPATPCEVAPALVRTPTLLPEITSSSQDVNTIEEDHSTATTSLLPVHALEPITPPVAEPADIEQSTAEDVIPPPEPESAFLLQSHPQEDDQSYIRAKARVAASKEGEVTSDWESAELSSVSDVDVDGEAWSEVE